MGEPSGQEHESEGLGQDVSVMRSFFESEEEFLFTDEIGKCGPDRNHCEIGKNNNFPFKHEEVFKGKCYIDRWVVDLEKAPTFPFKRPFVTKTLHQQKASRGRGEETKAEISIMKNLRHPHVAIFLGTWKRYDRLSILIFPAARFDLGESMKTISDDLENLWASASPPLALSCSKVEDRCKQKLCAIQRYFVCLSQALTYLHKQGVRHKDIKPKNILIDESGSAVVTDFGISKHFPLNMSHDTREHRSYDPKYVSPEMYDNSIRGDPSDVFSLGCVFLEMATLLLGKTLEDLDRYYIPKTSDPDIPTKDYGYHLELERVYEFLKTLGDFQINGAAETEDGRSTDGDLGHQDFMSHGDPRHQNLRKALPIIQKMMAEDPGDRLKAAELWPHFKYISPELCRDCDPRHKDVWKPTAAQEAAANEDLDKRRSLALSSDEEDKDRKRRRDSSSSASEDLQKVEHQPDIASRLHQIQPSDAIAYDRSVSTAKDMVTPKPNRLLRRPQSGDAATAGLELTSATAEVIPGNETYTNPETVNEKARVLIYNYKYKDTYYAPLYTLKGQYTKHHIPWLANHFNLREQDGSLIENIKLNTSLFIRFRRFWRQCPDIYLTNRPSD